jgi:hypothetical protein
MLAFFFVGSHITIIITKKTVTVKDPLLRLKTIRTISITCKMSKKVLKFCGRSARGMMEDIPPFLSKDIN